MSAAVKKLSDLFRCSELAAGEICKEVSALAQCFVQIYNAYELDYVLTSKRSVRRAYSEYQPSKAADKGDQQTRRERQLAERLLECQKALSPQARTLFDHARTTLKRKDQYCSALNLANCQIYLGLEETLSETLATLHEANQLRDPLKVSEGRLAYEAIRRDYQLLEWLDIS